MIKPYHRTCRAAAGGCVVLASPWVLLRSDFKHLQLCGTGTFNELTKDTK